MKFSSQQVNWVLTRLCFITFLLLTTNAFVERSFGQRPITSELIFPLHPQHNHAPGIAELDNGELLVSWYRGSGERKADDVAIYGARLAKGATKWSDSFVMVDTPEFPDGNTCLMTTPKGKLYLFWPLVLANSWESCVTQLLETDNPLGQGSPQWVRRDSIWLKPEDFSQPAIEILNQLVLQIPEPIPDRLQKGIETVKQRLPDKLHQRLGWQPRCKPTVLPSGRILLPLYSDTYSFSLMAISDDECKSWRASAPLMGYGNIQPSVLRRNDGTLVAYMRENGTTNRVRVSESRDEGETWGAVGSIDIPNPGSGLDAIRLESGLWVLIHNDLPQGRNRLALTISKDEGRSWHRAKLLENAREGSYHYPAIIQSRDGTIHAVYSYFVEGGKSMKHVAFSEAWLTSP